MTDFEDMDWEDVKEQLRLWREDNTRHSEEVVDMWHYCLQHHKHRLGDERWMVEEQVFVAALDCNRIDMADPLFLSLNKQFPSSLRVFKLKGMLMESLERYEEALAIYDSIIRDDETNSTARKRKVSIYRGQGRTLDAIKELTEYLKIFMSDWEGWQELCDLLLKEGEYAKAAFCMLELILSNPHNHLYFARYAEIKYTLGGLDNLEMAKTYFAQAVKLNPTNMRSLYGLYWTCNSLCLSGKLSSHRKKEIQKLADITLRNIADKYLSLGKTPLGNIKIEDSMEALGITEKA